MIVAKCQHTIYVHCRTGSLEIEKDEWIDKAQVHCRTGSLEMSNDRSRCVVRVHCRTGSLEK